MSSTRPDRPRVLVFIKGLGVGGAERLISESAAHYSGSPYQYAVAYVLPWKDQLAGDIRAYGIEVSCVGGDRGLDLWTPTRLRKLVAEWQPDIIHAHLPSAGIISRMVTKKRTVYTEHNLAHSYRRTTQMANRMTYRRNQKVIAVSAAVADSLAGYPGPTPVVIPNGVARADTDTAASVRSELGVAESTPLIVHVGNIRPHKGQQNLIEATRILVDSVPDCLVVSIGGEKNPGDLDAVQRATNHAGISTHLQFLGRRDDARAFLAAADVVVNPSDAEGLPVAILEAMTYARPVVATDVGGVSSVVIDHKTGLLVQPKDPAALAKAIVETLRSPHAKSWGEAGAELVDSRHGLRRMLTAYEEVYAELLDA